MNNFYLLLILCFSSINLLLTPNETIYNIDEVIEGNQDYKKAEFEFTSQLNQFFKYEFNTIPTSKVTAFRLDFDTFTIDMMDYQIYCTSVSNSTSDNELMETLKELNITQSSCIDGFKNWGRFDGIVKLDEAKPKLGIVIKFDEEKSFDGRIFLRVTERILGIDEEKPSDDESYSLVPFTVNIPQFRELSKSKILFYSNTRVLQMFHTKSNTSYPEKLFSGNILLVDTNPNIVRQKYHDASIMVLLPNPFDSYSNFGETFKFQVKLFDSNYLLDYFVSSNSEGRPLNSPLLINMTQCSNPYYVILNYNQQETSKTLIVEQIYGKMSNLSIATEFNQSTWDEMLENDLKEVDLYTRKYNLPANLDSYMDVYKIECEIPLMFNFYYINEIDSHPKMNYGDVAIFTLDPYNLVNIPFYSDMILPRIIIEIFNPVEDPIVIVEEQGETVYTKNTLISIIPSNLSGGINIKERGGLNDTRIIIKVGYSDSGWVDISGIDYVKYNPTFDIYSFEFPNDIKRYNYTLAELITSGTNFDDNVKYCFSSNIGAALKPSSENCYYVSSNNSYTLKTYNPLIMYRDYEYNESLTYYITFKAVTEESYFDVEPKVETYDTIIRNYEGINNEIIIDSSGNYSSILTPPKNKDEAIFMQVQVCDDNHTVNTEIINPLTGEVVVSDKQIPAGTKNFNFAFANELIDTEFIITGDKDVNVFFRMVGYSSIYTPLFNENQDISFDNSTNTLSIDSPITKNESMKYTVLVDREGVISKKGFTLCSFVGTNIEDLALYSESIVTSNKLASFQIDFNKSGINVGEKFEAIIYIEQQQNSQMVFLSKVFKGTVGEINIDTIYEINQEYSLDSTYLYKTITANENQASYYISYTPSKVLEVPIGAFSLELDSSSNGSFNDIACTFVENGADAMSMIEAVETAIEDEKSFCIGSQSKVNSKKYNYIFKYENQDNDTPKTMIIKVTNNELRGNFNIYMKTDQGVIVENTDFTTLKEYGQDEDSKKSVIPYIVDVYTLRGENSTDYVSKVLFYSQHLEMQMYYIPEDSNAPIKLFSGNIALVYTNPDLAIQKYHATTLVLISENLEGQEHPSLGMSFRFHTKMFKSDYQIKFFVSQNPEGRTLNFPLSLEMNKCTKENNKLYYILNYNKEESVRTLHLDMIFGSYSKARIAREINAENWDLLISNNMDNIENYQAELPKKSQHFDVVEITCNSPLLLNAYYSYDDYPYNNVKEGEIVVKELSAEDRFNFTVGGDSSVLFIYSISLFNPIESPSVTVRFPNGFEDYISENSLQTGFLLKSPEQITVINNCKSKTRFIFKIGFGVEYSEEWQEVEESQNLEGKLYANKNKYIYTFPTGEKEKNFTNVTFTVFSVNEVENTKFCYSTNLGIAIPSSRENCFITGKNIPYTLTFINPLIVGKDYKVETDKYYISFTPFEDEDYINIEITEEIYENSIRNEEGIHNQLTIVNGNAGTILSLPQKETSKILIQLKTCGQYNNPISYTIYNALTREELNNGTIDYNTYKDKDLYYITENIYLENELIFEGDSGVRIFTKHTGLEDTYSPVIVDYNVTFDLNNNTATIIKPIYNEEFTITVLVGRKDSLNNITQCDFAFKNKSTLAEYVNSFQSISSNIIIHFIDFETLGYAEGTEFDLLVYAEQTSNSKMEFIYPLFNGKVGKITGVLEIDEYIDGKSDIATKTFNYNSNSNYLYYDFTRKPTGNVASIKIKSESAIVNKIGCIFVGNTSSEADMVSNVNRAILEGNNACIGQMQNDSDGYDALVNANFADGSNRLVIQVLYGLGKEKEEKLWDTEQIMINIKTGGDKMQASEGRFNTTESDATIPYVIDLLEIRKSKEEYVSKILFYSNTREMEIFYIDEDSAAPVSLFKGNIMLVYTNEELINQKYHGATTMILITDALSSTEKTIIGEQYRFMTKFFNSSTNINYFLSSNPNGRPLNTPTTIEMTSCTQPYFYILNYNCIEGTRKLYIDTIFGEITSFKLTTILNDSDWDSLVTNMQEFYDDEIILEKQDRFHFDLMEIKCNLPLLINLFYIDPENTKVTNLDTGDIAILNLEKNQQQELRFNAGGTSPFAYSFSVLKGINLKPNIEITFNDANPLEITENGVYLHYSSTEYNRILISNKENSGSLNTRVIFKFGYNPEAHFQKIQNDIYSNQNVEGRKDNLYAYIYDMTNSKLNITGIDFQVVTNGDNVKFCYNTNLGAYINPSLENCYRVGKTNPYTISTLNPLVMYRNYYSDSNLSYYIGFKTVDVNQNITIVPKVKKYETNKRIMEGEKNKIIILKDNEHYDGIILTAPKNQEEYLFTHIQICTKRKYLSYEFFNAYNSSSLGISGEIYGDTNNVYKSVQNTKLDTELKLNSNYVEDGIEIFIKYVGLSYIYKPEIANIEINYNNESETLSWNQPIVGEEFIYTIYIDKKEKLVNKSYTLCDMCGISKLAHYSEILETDSENPNITIDFEKPELIGYEEFDVFIFAEQVNEGQMSILSEVYSFSSGEEPIPSDEEESEEEYEKEYEKEYEEEYEKEYEEEYEEEYEKEYEKESENEQEKEDEKESEKEDEKEHEKEDEKESEKEYEKEDEEENNEGSDSSNDKEKEKNDNTILIVVVCVVCLVVVVLVVVGALLVFKFKKKGNNNYQRNTSVELAKNPNNEFAGSEARDTNPIDDD